MTVFAAPKPAPRERTPKPLKRGKRLSPRNQKRAMEAYERDFGPKAGWIRSLCCVVSGSEGTKADPIVAAHVRSRGAGGDSRSLVPMLASLHQRLHDIGQESFQWEHDGIDLEEAADIIEGRWQQFAKSDGTFRKSEEE